MAVDLDKILFSYRDYYGTYHHHKEQMAYGATVLYLGAASAIILKGISIWSSCVSKFITASMCLLAFLATIMFVFWQFRKRELAADIVSACTTLLQKRLANKNIELLLKTDQYKGLDIPKALADGIRDIDKNRKLLGGPRVSEVITYVALILWTILAVASIT